MPVLSKLVPIIAGNFALQATFASIFVPMQNETFYDLCGAIGFLTGAGMSLYYPALRDKFWYRTPGATLPPITSFAPRQLLLTGCLCLWSGRLGSFLAQRAWKAGGDSRFDEIKKQPAKFAGFWFGQALWVSLVGLPVYLGNILPTTKQAPLGPRDWLGLSVFAASLAFEVIADRQKSEWRARKNAKLHDEKFISSGLWSISRHPNYVGEVGIQTGIWILSTTALSSPLLPKLTPWAAAVSPLFTWLLLRKGSGVPPLEASAQKKFGNDPAWQKYKNTVPVFFPWGGYR
ncbi:3-oxo-5-alpha-steroid 4-dehydrogenase [Ceratobasidium sp. AG-Ba]|nr:3-oxo-5-alpha-steroid 4-dehydrogenase [Ceratobasidium sp. AG-Ba]